MLWLTAWRVGGATASRAGSEARPPASPRQLAASGALLRLLCLFFQVRSRKKGRVASWAVGGWNGPTPGRTASSHLTRLVGSASLSEKMSNQTRLTVG